MEDGMNEFRKRLLELCNDVYDAGGKMAMAQEAQKEINDKAEEFIREFSGCEEPLPDLETGEAPMDI